MADRIDEDATHPLLAPGRFWQLNACLNYGPDQWHTYAVGYRRAAEITYRHVHANAADQDVLIYPFLFLWRHHIELQLKTIARDASRLLGEEWTVPREHDLTQLLGSARSLVERVYKEFGERYRDRDFASAKEASKKLKQIDPNAATFRYPEELDGSAPLGGVRHINFEVVHVYMTTVSDILDGVLATLSIFSDWQNEARSAY